MTLWPLLALIPITNQSVQQLPVLLAKDFVGEYILATGFNFETLRLNRDGTFASTTSDDVLIPGEEHPLRRAGKWALKAHEVEVRYRHPKGGPKTRWYIPVRWDGSMFLVESDRKQSFAQFVNDQRSPGAHRTIHVPFHIRSIPANALGPIEVPERFVNAFPWIK